MNLLKEEIKKIRDFVEQKVGGLRSDWDRRYKEDVNPRLKKLEK